MLVKVTKRVSFWLSYISSNTLTVCKGIAHIRLQSALKLLAKIGQLLIPVRWRPHHPHRPFINNGILLIRHQFQCCSLPQFSLCIVFYDPWPGLQQLQNTPYVNLEKHRDVPNLIHRLISTLTRLFLCRFLAPALMESLSWNFPGRDKEYFLRNVS